MSVLRRIGRQRDARRPGVTLWRVDQYSGQTSVRVQATQLDNRGELTAAQRRKVLTDWISFLTTSEARIIDLDLVSRVPQELLDAATGQSGLRRLAIKWGPYRDLSCLGRLTVLEELALGGATSVESLGPLVGLPSLSRLTVSGAHRVSDVAVLGSLGGLRELCFGNAELSSDRSVVVPDLEWTRGLLKLRELELPGIRLLDPDLSPLLDLPDLEVLALPLRKSYRSQVFDFAARSGAFARLAARYTAHDASVASPRAR